MQSAWMTASGLGKFLITAVTTKLPSSIHLALNASLNRCASLLACTHQSKQGLDIYMPGQVLHSSVEGKQYAHAQHRPQQRLVHTSTGFVVQQPNPTEWQCNHLTSQQASTAIVSGCQPRGVLRAPEPQGLSMQQQAVTVSPPNSYIQCLQGQKASTCQHSFQDRGRQLTEITTTHDRVLHT